MLFLLRTTVVGVIATLAALVAVTVGSPTASADPWAPCASRAPHDRTVRVFPRTPTAHGPAGRSSVLTCGSRFSGFVRIQTEWTGVPDWQATADAAIARVLTTDRTPTHDRTHDTWTFSGPGAVVVTDADGSILDAIPAAP